MVWYWISVETNPPRNEPDHTEKDGAKGANWVAARDQQPRDGAGDEADDQQNDNESQHGLLTTHVSAKH